MFKSALIVYYNGQHEKILPGLEIILKNANIDFVAVDREKIAEKDYSRKDIVIVIGGDGTFLRANHLNKNVPMIGINPNPGRKEGFYMQADANDFPEILEKALSGKYRIINLLRLHASVNGKRLNHFILNDVYIGDIKPYLLFNYEIKVKEAAEFQRSSGVIVGTPSGSSAWTKSAGGSKMKMEEKRFQYVTRELYTGKITKNYRLRNGIINKNESLELIPKSKGIVVIDSISPEYKVDIDDKIVVSAAKEPLKYIVAR
jgi:NAD kinase